MSVEVFCYRLSKTQVPAKDKMEMPRWLEKYATTANKVAHGWQGLRQELMR
jgi:hypothetical protein